MNWKDQAVLEATEHRPELRALAGGNMDDLATLLAEAEIEGWVDEGDPNRINGCTDWVGYIPSTGRAVWVTNGDPIWFDASSLEDAIEQAQSGAELDN